MQTLSRMIVGKVLPRTIGHVIRFGLARDSTLTQTQQTKAIRVGFQNLHPKP